MNKAINSALHEGLEDCTNEGKLKVLKARYLSLSSNHVEDKHTE